MNHIDENKHNNYYKNLEWITMDENNKHSFCKKVHKLNLETNAIVGTYRSLTEAATSLELPNIKK